MIKYLTVHFNLCCNTGYLAVVRVIYRNLSVIIPVATYNHRKLVREEHASGMWSVIERARIVLLIIFPGLWI